VLWRARAGLAAHFFLPQGERLAAEPSIGRAARVEGTPAPEADLTRALYEQYGSQIFRYCLHQLGSREEAEDAVQSTFLNAFRGIKRGIVPELESAWLFKIAQNVCLSRRRSTWRRDRIESPTNFELVEELMPAPSRRADELMGLQDVLEQLPENQRRAILLREWQGLSYHEIADELELSQAAVETLIFRARRALAQGLEEPPAPKKRRLVRGADWGNVLAGLKSLLLGGGAAVKVAATVAVVSATTVAATAPVVENHSRPSYAKPAAAASVSAKPASGTSAATSLAANLAGGAPAPAHRLAARGALLSAATAAATPAAAAAVSPDDAAVPAAEVSPTPPPAPAAAPSQPAAGSDAGGQTDSSSVVTKPVEVKNDSSPVTTTVATAPTTQPAGSGSDASSASPAPQQMPVPAPVTTTLSAPPAGDNATSPTLVLPPTLTKKLDSPPATSPAGSTPAAPTPSTPTVTLPSSVPPPSLSVQPPATTTSGLGTGTSGSGSHS
jgi:RNA polymerase sigma factor (sigma-70 family)